MENLAWWKVLIMIECVQDVNMEGFEENLCQALNHVYAKLLCSSLPSRKRQQFSNVNRSKENKNLNPTWDQKNIDTKDQISCVDIYDNHNNTCLSVFPMLKV